MNLDITNFVDINLEYHKAGIIDSSRPITTVLVNYTDNNIGSLVSPELKSLLEYNEFRKAHNLEDKYLFKEYFAFSEDKFYTKTSSNRYILQKAGMIYDEDIVYYTYDTETSKYVETEVEDSDLTTAYLYYTKEDSNYIPVEPNTLYDASTKYWKLVDFTRTFITTGFNTKSGGIYKNVKSGSVYNYEIPYYTVKCKEANTLVIKVSDTEYKDVEINDNYDDTAKYYLYDGSNYTPIVINETFFTTYWNVEEATITASDYNNNPVYKLANIDTTTLINSTDETIQLLTKYMDIYFRNLGQSVKLYFNISYDEDIKNVIDTLPVEQITIVYVNNEYSNLLSVAQDSITTTGIYQKIFVDCYYNENIDEIEQDKVKNYVVKYSENKEDCMTIAAYLSKVNTYNALSINDYCFTKEVVHTVYSDNDLYLACKSQNINIDMVFANAICNLGGDITNGDDLLVQYVLIILHQTLTNRLEEVLSYKIKGQQGLNKITTTIASELNRYLDSTYLITSKIWTDEDYVINYNGQAYTIISKGTALLNGYKVVALPFNSLSDTDKAKNSTPPIYIILATTSGIRFIKIDGEVI